MPARLIGRMTRQRRALLDRLLDELLDLSADERDQQLTQLIQRYPRLGAWLKRLVEASASPTQFLNQRVSRLAQQAMAEQEQSDPTLPAGTRLGAWRIIEPAGMGGMGVVYQAERADGAFEMQAAIKLIRESRVGLSERLLSERRLLARLDHPAISRLIDGGITEDERAWLAMEWVPGEDLADCDRSRIDLLDVFCQIADALTHAHQRMVVHGDIKPRNVRVMQDGRARLLDFGVARLLEEDGIEDNDGHRALTPAFAAPEQLAGQPATAQSDVWAMGALLGWLLSGRTSEAGQRLQLDRETHSRAADLQAVIDKACADDPARRYESAAALKDEIVRIVEHHPVEARPAGWMRQIGLWSRRNPLAAVLASLMGSSLVLGASLLAWQAQIVTAERDLARFENTRWEIMGDQLITLFQAVATEADSSELGARELLDGSVDRINSMLGDDELGKAYIKSMLGGLYIALQDYQNAALILRQFIAADDGSTTPALRSQAYGNLAQAEERLGNHEIALEKVDLALDMLRTQPGDHRRRLSELHQIRGRALRSQGDWPGAIEALQAGLSLALTLSEQPNRTAGYAYNNLGATLIHAGQFEQAGQAFNRSLAIWQALGLAESNDALNVVNNLAAIYFRLGDLVEAEAMYGEAIRLRRERFGESAALAASMNNRGLILIIRHRLIEAREQLEDARELMTRFVGQSAPDYGIVLRSLGLLSLTEGDFSTAQVLLDEAEGILHASLGPDHMFSTIVAAHQAYLGSRIDPGSVVERFAEPLEALNALGPPAEIHLASALCEKAVVLIDAGRYDLALSAATTCLQTRQARLPEGNWEIAKAEALQALARQALDPPGDPAALDHALASLTEAYGPNHPRLLWLQELAGMH